MRWVITRVLPLPGPAKISTGPRVVVTASRCGSFNPASKLVCSNMPHHPPSVEEKSLFCFFSSTCIAYMHMPSFVLYAGLHQFNRGLPSSVQLMVVLL